MSQLTSNGYRPLVEGHKDYRELAGLELDLMQAVGGQERFEEKLRSFFRSAIDEVIDTARTGRHFFHQLEKTEKTYLGTKFEILLRDWLQVPRGVRLDLLIGEREVDVKSTTGGGSGWMIPPEAIDQFCVLLRVNEALAKCAFGIVRARREFLRNSENRDAKTSFSAAGTANIWWLVSDFDYTPNFWTRIEEPLRHKIMTAGKGAKRLATLFENCLGMAVSRVQVAAIAAQDDYMKRIRRNGGARDLLAPKGIAVLYSENDRDLMVKMGLTFGFREFVSCRPETAEQEGWLRSSGHID
ncbi:MAG: NaeI family type II restriction endonuclease [Novosphingobium sp.]